MINVIVRGRGGGKTYLAIEALKFNEHAKMVVHSTQYRDDLVSQYQIPKDRFIVTRSFTHLWQEQARGYVEDLIIDNLDLMLPGRTRMVTMTGWSL